LVNFVALAPRITGRRYGFCDKIAAAQRVLNPATGTTTDTPRMKPEVLASAMQRGGIVRTRLAV
jgi:hypothetical protein